VDGNGMALAVEVLICTLPMANLMRDGKTFQIPSMMQTGKGVGMQTMDDALMALVKAGTISARDAYMYAQSKQAFKPLYDREIKNAAGPLMTSGFNV
jgi:twitching motility protein PilT